MSSPQALQHFRLKGDLSASLLYTEYNADEIADKLRQASYSIEDCLTKLFDVRENPNVLAAVEELERAYRKVRLNMRPDQTATNSFMNSISDIADVVELQTWATDRAYSISSLKEDLESALAGDEIEFAEQYARETFEEIETRAALLATSYPFDLEGVTIRPNARKTNSAYLFCLGLQFLRGIPLEMRTREFEGVVKVAAESYFRGKGVRVGAPWSTPEITEYKDLLQTISI